MQAVLVQKAFGCNSFMNASKEAAVATVALRDLLTKKFNESNIDLTLRPQPCGRINRTYSGYGNFPWCIHRGD
jgi:hypothetical protein